VSLAGRLPLRVALPFLGDHPSSYVVRDFVQALQRQGVAHIRLPRRIGSVLTRSGLRLPRPRRGIVIVPLMGPRFDVLATAALYGQPVPFCWDVWEPQWDLWASALSRARPPLVITTAEASAAYLASRLHSSVVVHLPEAINLGKYRPGGRLSERGTDVLEMGRRNARWHDAVTAGARASGVRHLYERAPGEVIFPDEASLIDGLADSKISVCFPSSVTHPERSGSVSTLTSRYLESIASRCLVLGEAPAELPRLLGFDPAVRSDMAQPWHQLRLLLGSIELYQPQVDEAYEQVMAVGGWDYRIRQLLSLLRAP
jgi:hypothetical protein